MNNITNHFDAAVFDMDGLLLDSERISLLVFNETLVSFGLDRNDELFKQIVGTNAATCKQILRAGLAGQTDPDHFGKVWFNRYLERTAEEPITIKLGAKDLLTHLQALDMPIAVATSTKTPLAITKLENAGLKHFFQFIIGGDQVKHGKPHPEIYQKSLQQISSVPERTLAFEDSENGVRAAVAAGMTVIQIPDIVQPSESLKSLGHIILDDLTQVISHKFYE